MRRFFSLWIPLGVLFVINLAPVYLLVKQAVTTDKESLAWPPTYAPREVTSKHFDLFLSEGELMRGFAMSLSVAAGAALLALCLGVPAGWAMARSKRLGGKVVASLVIARLFPVVAVGIPLAVLFIKLGLYNHPQGIGLLLAHTTLLLPFTTLIAYSTFKAVPKDLEEQAAIDGCSTLGAFVRVSLPLAKTGIAAAGILGFIISWDEFAYSLILQVTNRNLPPLVYYYSAYGSVGLSSAISVIMLIPAVIITFLVQKFIKAGYLAGAVK